VSWQHVNLHGEYDFSDDKLRDSVGLNLSEILGFRSRQFREGSVTTNPKPDTELSKSV